MVGEGGAQKKAGGEERLRRPKKRWRNGASKSKSVEMRRHVEVNNAAAVKGLADAGGAIGRGDGEQGGWQRDWTQQRRRTAVLA